MRIYYDTEFLEDGKTIELISIGMVTEEGDAYYAVNRDLPMVRIAQHAWLMDNVVPHLPVFDDDPRFKSREQIAKDVTDLVLSVPDPQLWAWYGAYDHVVLCQLFGSMIDLPMGFPMWTNDLRQEVNYPGAPRLPQQENSKHDALADAMWVKDAHHWLMNRKA